MFPKENFHYRKNIRVIGGVDLNAEKFLTEYKKRYYDRYIDYKRKNEPYFLTALAARQYNKYMEIVHGPEAALEAMTRNKRNRSMQVMSEAVKELRKQRQKERLSEMSKQNNQSVLL